MSVPQTDPPQTLAALCDDIDQDYELMVKVRVYGGGTAEEAADALRDFRSTFDLSRDREVEIIEVRVP